MDADRGANIRESSFTCVLSLILMSSEDIIAILFSSLKKLYSGAKNNGTKALRGLSAFACILYNTLYE